MRGYLVRRLYQTVIVLFVVVSLLFLMFRLLPGNPVAMMIDQSLDEVAQQRLLKDWGLDAPLHQQYLLY
jgi:peptide/nickel transport system permease protein